MANPTALLLAAALMLEHCHLGDKVMQLRSAIDAALNIDRRRTGDLGGKSSTKDLTRALVARIASG